MQNLEGRVALVTGGSRGIGRALCLALAERDLHVYACARDAEALRETAQMAGPDASITVLEADVTDLDAMRAVIGCIEAERARLDIVINNAGVLGPRTAIEEVTLQQWRQTMSVNLDGVFITSKLAIGPLRGEGGGMILNVSSSVGRRGRGHWGPYAVSKHGVEGLSDTLADELADDDICVVSVNPGGTATQMRHKAYPDEDPDTLPTPEEVAQTFMLLIDRLEVAQTGRKYNSRDLMEFVGGDANGEDLPFVG